MKEPESLVSIVNLMQYGKTFDLILIPFQALVVLWPENPVLEYLKVLMTMNNESLKLPGKLINLWQDMLSL